MIIPDLRDLINRHKPIERLNNNNNKNNKNKNNNNNDNNNTDTNNNDTDNDNDNDYYNNKNDNNGNDRGEWKIMLRMYIKCISTKSFNETSTMHP